MAILKSGFVVLCMGLSVAAAPVSAGEQTYKTTSDVLAVALPAVAAAISVAQDDGSGLLQLAKAEGLTLLSTEILKRATHQTRPNGKDDKSFPSGHTAVAFAAAQYMQERGGWQYGIPAYALAGLVGYSRVEAREHYWRDVVAGAALGMAAGAYFTDKREHVRLSVMLGRNSAQATLNTSW
ncbi:MAG: phosphatase PAP2 family protein [Azonexus sp.]|nr:phosphatase PAP2 family protein [Azonexus sp.]